MPNRRSDRIPPLRGRSLRLALESLLAFPALACSGRLRLRRDRLGRRYRLEEGEYEVFRESVASAAPLGGGAHVVLVVGFRLRLIGSARLPHRVFQRLCILTTPFWSGLRGFRVKLWMVSPRSRDYAGIYDWAGQADAERYLRALLPVLRAVSVPGSVWHRIEAPTLEAFLGSHGGAEGADVRPSGVPLRRDDG